MPKRSLNIFRSEFTLLLLIGAAIVLATVIFVMRSFQTKTAPTSHNFGLETRTITVGSAKLSVEVAATDAEQRQGLSDRPTLGREAGMIFPMSPPSQSPFWMPRMNFPLDFIYLNGGRVVELKKNVSNNDLTPFAPNEPVDAVLEVNADYIAAHGINIGDSADY